MDWLIDALYEIYYVNNNGIKTRRVIRVIETRTIKRYETVVYIRAFCYLRNEERTFREDNIVQARLIAKQEAGADWVVPSSTQTHEAISTYKAEPKLLYTDSTLYKGKNDFPSTTVESKPSHSYRIEHAFHNANNIEQNKSTVYANSGKTEPVAKGYAAETRVSPYNSDYFSQRGSYKYPQDSNEPIKKIKLSRILGIATVLGLVFIWYLNIYAPSQVKAETKKIEYVPFTTTVPKPTPTPPPPALEEVKLGGLILRIHRDSSGTWYEVPARGYVGKNKKEAIKAIRVPNFTNYTGITDTALIARYLAADTDNNGKLSYRELENFAKNMQTYVTYKSNDIALRPDIFLAEGGGDCEDFALYVAGLLRFWGWQPYIACFDPPVGSGHAVCFSYEGSGGFPKSYNWYTLSGKKTWDGTLLPDGKYIPIDFEYVGKLSNAVGEGWELRHIFIPEKIWGLKM